MYVYIYMKIIPNKKIIYIYIYIYMYSVSQK